MIFTANSDFEKLWGESIPTIEFDLDNYTILGVDEPHTFAVEDDDNNDITELCTYTFDNDYVYVVYDEDDDEYNFVVNNEEELEPGEYNTTVTATYKYKTATITATATINITVESDEDTTAR